MTSNNVTEPVEPSEAAPPISVDDRMIDELVGRAQAEGLQLTGEGGLLHSAFPRTRTGPPETTFAPHQASDARNPAQPGGLNGIS